jgi:NADPH2:quinone reductase
VLHALRFHQTGGVDVAVVYDDVGRDTFAVSLDALKRRGLLLCLGTDSGSVPPLDVLQLALKGSLFVTRPALADFIATAEERDPLAGELFGHGVAGRIRIEIHQRYVLKDAVQAHRDLELRKTTGSSIFVV